MGEEKLVPLNIRIPRRLKKLMKRYIDLDTHKDLSEFARDAIREKIQKDAPDLYRQLFQTEKEASKEWLAGSVGIFGLSSSIRAKGCSRSVTVAE